MTYTTNAAKQVRCILKKKRKRKKLGRECFSASHKKNAITNKRKNVHLRGCGILGYGKSLWAVAPASDLSAFLSFDKRPRSAV